MTPSHFLILLKDNLLRIYSGLELIIGYFGFTYFGVLVFLIDFTKFDVLDFLEIVRILFSCVLARLEFSVLVIFLDLDRNCRACFRSYFVFSWIPCLFFSCGPRAIFFSCFVLFTNLTANKIQTFWKDSLGF